MGNGITVGLLLVVVMLIGGFLLTILINLLLVPVTKTPKQIIQQIVDLMKLQKDDTLVDLGCGDGKMILEAYANAKCRCYGLDLSPIMIIIARTFRILRYPGNKDIVFSVENVYEVPFDDYTKIYCYLNQKSMRILKKRFVEFIKGGGEIFSYRYEIKGLKAKRKVKLNNDELLYIYRS